MDMPERSTSQLQADVEQQRQKLSDDIDRLAERLTPGRLLDEVLDRTKNGGGAFFTNLGHSATANPVPTALLGVSLAWLMARTGEAAARPGTTGTASRGRDLPLATVSGGPIRRVSHGPDADGENWSRFADGSGRTYKAKSDSLGRRAGHFVDDAGKTYRGFVDGAGQQIRTFQDEAGVALDEVSGWASDTWAAAGDAVSDAGHAVRSGAESVARHASDAGVAIGDGARRLNDSIASSLSAQPLIGAALAFVAGAALASVLPHTELEDGFVGDSADSLKDMAGDEAEHAYGAAKEKAADVYDKAKEALAPAQDGA